MTTDQAVLEGPPAGADRTAAGGGRRWARPGVVALARPLVAAALLVAVGLGVESNPFWLRIATSAAIAYVLTASFNLIFGYAGLFSLSHVALYGVGGYGSVIMETRWDVPFWVAVPLSIVLAALAGLLVALPTARLGGVFLALGTLAFAIAVEELFLKWTSVTGGAQGFLGIPPPEVGDKVLLGGTLDYYWVAAVGALVSFEVLWRATHAGVGRRLVALRESEVATQSVGINPFGVRVTAFVLSGALAGLAGALFAHFTLFISPESFSLAKMVEVLIVTLIGGAGTAFGPVIGVAALVAIQEGGHHLGEASPLLFGAAIVAIISFAPGGLVGIVSALWRRFGPTRRPPAPAGASKHADPAAAAVVEVVRDDHVLEVRDVSLRFEGLQALRDVGFRLTTGEVLGLIGPNGAGKTSAVNVITGRIRPTAGAVLLDGDDLVGLPPHQVARRGVVRTFQATRLVPTFDLLTNVILGRDRFSTARLGEEVLHLPRSVRDDVDARERALELLDLVGVGPHAFDLAADLPYGVLRRAEIARAMAVDPIFLLLDEPGAGLSAFERDEVATAIRAVTGQGVGCLLIDHNVAFVAGLCSRLVVLTAGVVLTEGATADVLAHADVIEAYLGKAVPA